MKLAWRKTHYNTPEFAIHWAQLTGGASQAASVTNVLWGEDASGRFREIWRILGNQIRRSVK